MTTVNENQTLEIGARQDDGTIYAGELNGKNIYAAPEDATGFFSGKKVEKTFNGAARYAERLNRKNYLGHNDWHVPSKEELDVLCTNKDKGALKGTFDAASYWSSSFLNEDVMGSACSQYFGGGNETQCWDNLPWWHHNVRCVR